MHMRKQSLKRALAFGMAFALCVSGVTVPKGADAAKQTKSVKLNKKKATLYKGAAKKYSSIKLKATVKPKKAAKVKWKSSNKKVAKVSSKGVVTAKKAGKATITAKSGKKSAKCKITVKKWVKVSKVSVSKSSVSLNAGDTEKIKVSVSPAKASIKAVSYKTSNAAVATVSGKGVITAVSEGTAKITVKALDGSNKKATVTVTVSGTAPGTSAAPSEAPGTSAAPSEAPGTSAAPSEAPGTSAAPSASPSATPAPNGSSSGGPYYPNASSTATPKPSFDSQTGFAEDGKDNLLLDPTKTFDTPLGKVDLAQAKGANDAVDRYLDGLLKDGLTKTLEELQKKAFENEKGYTVGDTSVAVTKDANSDEYTVVVASSNEGVSGTYKVKLTAKDGVEGTFDVVANGTLDKGAGTNRTIAVLKEVSSGKYELTNVETNVGKSGTTRTYDKIEVNVSDNPDAAVGGKVIEVLINGNTIKYIYDKDGNVYSLSIPKKYQEKYNIQLG